MQINVSGHHVDVSQALEQYVRSKLERIERHFDQVTSVHVVLTVEKQRHKAEATMNVSRGQLFADSVAQDMYAAIDGLTDKLDRQVKRHKEKLTDHHRGNGGLKDQAQG
jgi:putative sigma-54 modulation protein